MIVVSERDVPALIDVGGAFDAVSAVFAAMASGEARNFPVVREALGHADALYGFKSGFDRKALALGVKSGGYWPGNAQRGLTNHQSTVILFDADTGQPSALVGGNHLTALRTAAASAVSIHHLAPPGALTLGILGAGHQARFQLQAALAVHSFDRVIAWNRSPEKLSSLAGVAADHDAAFAQVDLPTLGREADVIITITSSFAPILMDAHVSGPTHIACMGTDTIGKQEVEPALIARARCFTDEVAQSVTLGECQHAVAAGAKPAAEITEIGAVINATHPGRGPDDVLTIFDGTGVGLQDVAVARAVAARAVETGVATKIDL